MENRVIACVHDYNNAACGVRQIRGLPNAVARVVFYLLVWVIAGVENNVNWH